MGKLHTLRRAILREPEKWRKMPLGAWDHGTKYGGWKPCWAGSYRAFVKSVLKDIDDRVGNADNGRGGVSGLAPESRLPGEGPVSRGPNAGSSPAPIST
jgi:hypothetical protein